METISLRLVREDRLIEGLRMVVERYVGDRLPERASDALVTLADHLRARIQLEEKQLFPAIEALVGVPDFAPTQRMRRQHRVLFELVVGIEAALGDGNFAAAAGDLRELCAALHTHAEEERRVLYPLAGAGEHGHA